MDSIWKWKYLVKISNLFEATAGKHYAIKQKERRKKLNIYEAAYDICAERARIG